MQSTGVYWMPVFEILEQNGLNVYLVNARDTKNLSILVSRTIPIRSRLFMSSPEGNQVPFSTFVHFGVSNTPLAVNHQGQFPSVTISFNLAPGVALGNATGAIEATERELRLPASIHTSFAGSAAAFQDSLSSEPLLVLAALLAVYIGLGILYESYIHPVTILSTLPSAGTGALLALLLFRMDLDVISLIGIILLIGIVKKNAIMMIDFALEQERQ